LNSDSSEQFGYQSHQAEEGRAKADTDLREYRQLKKDHKDLVELQKENIAEHRDLADKVARMTENLKKMKYEEAMESKANITTNRLNR
jgi:hypothetical protein